MIKVAINGFGRIGRPSFKIAFVNENMEVVAINDLTDIKTAAHLLKYDSSFGRYDKEVSIDEENSELIVDGTRIKFLKETDAEKLPWKELGVDVVLECTGVYEDKEKNAKHIAAGKMISRSISSGSMNTNIREKISFPTVPARPIAWRR
jgi:glyceraldehyde 3-phosphate dehydrogenase